MNQSVANGQRIIGRQIITPQLKKTKNCIKSHKPNVTREVTEKCKTLEVRIDLTTDLDSEWLQIRCDFADTNWME